ncbi:PREDICTED: probable leucine-rich repeat receptor-like protein kinase At1g35710 [Prunus mume]|uniref:Probable leucine-rich repeat receptor-like protein kinase At1g35710 n=1 Tax=Prunus mume TaxID=102107 RepID=A0ABM0PV22_PRUMU|nr:PREDICTED: probable leucine-rich repeat receptor-like protein kinase At1g35710 [Prunus mume]
MAWSSPAQLSDVGTSHLEYLNLRSNNFSRCQILDFIGSLSNLRYLDLSYAKFGGEIPYQLENLTHLEYLDLSSDGFISAKNLNWLSKLSCLKHFDLSSTNLTGVVGWLEAVNMLPKLRNLILRGCNLPPPIISSVSVMNSSKSLVHVDLSYNNLNSSIFQWMSGTHANLVDLYLSGNNLNGSSIPDDFGNMSSLAYLTQRRDPKFYLDISDNNGIMGAVDSKKWLGLLPLNLVMLGLRYALGLGGACDLQDNERSMESIRLRSCKMGPSFPKWLQTQKSVSFLDISDNGITDTIPSWLWDLSIFDMDLSHNQVRGTIGNLRSEFPPKLNELEFLDLSRNQINSRIPTSLSWIARLAKLDLSENNLFGKIPIGTQLQSFEYACGGNRLLCGAPLPKTCPEEEKGLGQPVLVNQDGQYGLITQGYYISMGLGFAVGFWGVCGTLLLNRSCRYTYFNFLTFLNDWLHVKAAIISQRMLNR